VKLKLQHMSIHGRINHVAIVSIDTGSLPSKYQF